MSEPTREELIALCDRGVVPQSQWFNRDSASAQKQLAVARTLLMAGCDFRLDDGPYTKSDADTWWVEITYEGFDFHEVGDLSVDTFYIPTDARLRARAGRDWY